MGALGAGPPADGRGASQTEHFSLNDSGLSKSQTLQRHFPDAVLVDAKGFPVAAAQSKALTAGFSAGRGKSKVGRVLDDFKRAMFRSFENPVSIETVIVKTYVGSSLMGMLRAWVLGSTFSGTAGASTSMLFGGGTTLGVDVKKSVAGLLVDPAEELGTGTGGRLEKADLNVGGGGALISLSTLSEVGDEGADPSG